MPANKQKIEHLKITELPFSEDFKSVAQKFGFTTMEQVIGRPVTELLELNGFNYHMLQELIQFLEERDLTNLLKQ